MQERTYFDDINLIDQVLELISLRGTHILASSIFGPQCIRDALTF